MIKGTKTWCAVLNSIQKIDALDHPETPIKRRLQDTVLMPSPTKRPKLLTSLNFGTPSSSFSIQDNPDLGEQSEVLDNMLLALPRNITPSPKRKNKSGPAGKHYHLFSISFKFFSLSP